MFRCFRAVFLLGIVFLELYSAKALAREKAPIAEPEPVSSEIFSPRVYGRADAPVSVVLTLIPGNDVDEQLFVNLYPTLQRLGIEGKVKLEIRLWAQKEPYLPLVVAAECVNPAMMPIYLFEVIANHQHRSFTKAADMEKFAVIAALMDQQLLPTGLTEEQFRKRLSWCLSKRREAMVFSELSRHKTIFEWNLRNSGYGGGSAVAVNQKIFDGDFSADNVIDFINGQQP